MTTPQIGIFILASGAFLAVFASPLLVRAVAALLHRLFAV